MTGFGSTYQLSERVAAHVRETIMAGGWRGGDFIRTEHLAAELGVSATPVREALMALQGEGFVRWQPRRGFQVASLSAQDVRDLFWVQASIAGELAARAAARISESDVDRIRRLQDELVAAARGGDADLVDERNHEIHRIINTSAGAARLGVLLGLVVHYVPRRFFGSIGGWAAASTRDHGAILAALAARDPEAARTAMSAHVTHAGDLLAEHLAARGVLVQP